MVTNWIYDRKSEYTSAMELGPMVLAIGVIAQLGEHRVCNAGVVGSSPSGSIGLSLEITAFAASGFQQI